MITADFYPATTTISGGNGDSNYDTELTDVLTALTPDGDDFARAYYLYYVPWELVPPVYKASCAYVNNNSISARCITPPQNVAATFVGAYSTSSLVTVTRSYTADYSVSNGAIVRNTTSESSRNYRLYNNYSIRKNSANVGFIGQTSSGGFFSIIGINPETGASSYSLSYTSSPSSGDENIEKFLNGELYFTISSIGSSGGVDMFNTSFTIGVNDIDEETGYYHFEENGIDYYVGINAYTINTKRDVNTQNVSTNYTNPAPALRLLENDHYHLRAAISGWCSRAASDSIAWYNSYASIRLDTQTFSWGYFTGDSDGISNYVIGDFNFDLSRNEFNDAPLERLWVFNKTILRKASNTVLRLYRLYTPSEIIAHLRLYQRASLSNQYAFSDDYKIPKYTDTDSATTDFLIGDHETIGDFLRPWQDEYFKVSEFTPDDIPPYVPPGPTPGDDDSGGDDIRPSDWTNLRIGAANNFVTLYGMTAETVSDFGRKMWAELADPEFWQMVGTAFTNDFSINPADMMRYFVSLRYFPFDVSDFAHTTSSGVYIGRAASPIAPSVGVAYPLRLTNSTVQVSGGTLTIPRLYNDFRDYEPCTTVQVHIPFCGSVEVPASEVMGHTMDLTYKIDLQTGAMLGVLCVSSNTYYVIATVAGTVGASIPITANNNIEFLQRIATLGGGLVGGGVSGALKGAMLGGEVGAVVGAVAGTVGGGVGALAGLPPVTVHKQGNASGFANLGGVPYAYATVQRSRFELPDNYGHTTGFACDFAATVGELSGYAVCDNVDTSGLSCNSRERDEIKRLLESGVYV